MPAADRNTDLDRLACLQAMGLTLYSSRRDLPGAAPSRRVLTPAAFTAAPSSAAAPTSTSAAGPGTKTARAGSVYSSNGRIVDKDCLGAVQTFEYVSCPRATRW